MRVTTDTGYQARIAQTLPPTDPQSGKVEGPGIITGLEVESAAARDGEALLPMYDQLEKRGHLPEKMAADCAYGKDDNVEASREQYGVELISPVSGKAPQKANPKHKGCSKEKAKKARLAARREREQTKEWRDTYAKRSGIEGLNRALDLTTGFKQVRVRGLVRMSVSLHLKASGWNIGTAAKILKNRRKKANFWHRWLERMTDVIRKVTGPQTGSRIEMINDAC